MKNWKKFFVAAVAVGTVFSVNPAASEAAYELNPEVKTATPALLAASQMGVQVYENPDLQGLADKDAIVVMTFGTTFAENRAKTINATIEGIKAAHPGVKVVTAYTSHIIIDRVAANEGIKYPTPEEALAQLKAEGYTRVALTTLDVIPGMEYNYKLGVFNSYKQDFKKMTIGTPLMYWQGQEEQADDVTEVLEAFATQFPKTKKGEGIVMMAHGTPNIANAYYAVIQEKLQEMGYDNVFIETVEGWPSLETIIPKLKAKKIKKVTIMPFMMVAGDHANNDMAGSEEDSHKSILEKEGIKVEAYIHGLGENEAVRNVFVERANAAWDALEATGQAAE
ncbi:MAG: sirohydrochlorin cobaltochelatase [Anaerovibrio slackiae]|uniref:sirohydrochlorin cobaltochelatase n=2 Tax=Anaerovibrio slackiae TaxID=2652309 RepID=UPI0023F233ED|nr:sirohydrochlorin cobaltochelatase [Anaerovibrio slackiae]MDD6164120.1 sirohydrochlorin cobaltochelatase [Anaerovibrio slackiae]